MSPLDLNLGVDLDIVDDPAPIAAPTATGTGFLIHATTQPGAPTTLQTIRSPSQALTVFPNEPALQAAVDAYFAVSGADLLYIAPLAASVAAAAALIPPTLGPGQLMAPSVVAATDINVLRDWAWANNRVYVAQAPDAATDAALTTLATAIIDNAGGRNTMLEADFLRIPGVAGGAVREVGASIVKAALMARSDRITGNPNLAAAGNHTPGAGGETSYVLSIKNERAKASQDTLARAQVNSFRTVNGRVRSYGYWTLANLAVLPQWWDMGGSRTVMAVRAREQAVAEEMMFGQVAADGAFLDKYKGALSGALAEYQRLGAIYGTDNDPGYVVDVGAAVNPVANVARGIITASIRLRTSPFAAELKLTLTRRAITERVV